MGTRGTWTAFSVILLACVLSGAAGCPHKVKSAAKTIEALVTSPSLVGAECTAYDIGQTEWGPFYFSAGLFEGRPVAAFRSPGGFSVAVADKPLPQTAGDWQVELLDSRPKARMISLAASDAGVFVSYMVGTKESTRYMLASCVDADPADPLTWVLEELPADLGVNSIRSLAVGSGWLALACRDQDSRLPICVWRDPTADGAGWAVAAASESLSGAHDLTLLELNGAPALGYSSEDSSSLGLLIGTAGLTVGGWRSTAIASGPVGEFGPSHLSFATQGKTAGVVFHQGDESVLRLAIAADAAAASPSWQFSDIVSWEMLGTPDLLFDDGLPVVVYEADGTALWAFFATTATPAGFRDWRMCKLSEDLGTEGYNGVVALIIDGHLLAVYIETDANANATLGATLIEIPE